jgi:hypothetical protein
LNRIENESANKLPTQVEIEPGETAILNISIDTGIR